MELQEAINKRHSIRKFEKKSVPRAILKKLILSASKAPSGKNEQPWNFYVLYSKNILNKLISEVKTQVSDKELQKLTPKIKKIAIRFYENLGNAPHIILVYRNKKKQEPPYQYFNDIAGISSAIENLMLSAVEQKLGTCWIGTFEEIKKKISKMLKIPKDKEFVTGILIGYPKRGYMPLKREKKKINQIMKFI